MGINWSKYWNHSIFISTIKSLLKKNDNIIHKVILQKYNYGDNMVGAIVISRVMENTIMGDK